MGCTNTRTLHPYHLSMAIALCTVVLCAPFATAEPDYMAALGIVAFDGKIDAPNFTLPTARGKSLQLREFKGQVVLLNFWATW